MKTFETIPTLKQFNTFKECLLQNIFLKKTQKNPQLYQPTDILLNKTRKANNWTVTDITNPTATLFLTHFPCFLTRSSITIVHYIEKMFQFRARGILQSPLGKLIRSLQTQTEHCLSHVCPGSRYCVTLVWSLSHLALRKLLPSSVYLTVCVNTEEISEKASGHI